MKLLYDSVKEVTNRTKANEKRNYKIFEEFVNHTID